MYIAKHFDNNYFCSLVINMQWFWQSVCFSSGNACCCTWLCTLSHKQNLVWVRHDCRTLLRERTAMCIDRRITLCSGYSCNSWRQTDVNSRVRFLLFWRIYRAKRSDITLESWMASPRRQSCKLRFSAKSSFMTGFCRNSLSAISSQC